MRIPGRKGGESIFSGGTLLATQKAICTVYPLVRYELALVLYTYDGVHALWFTKWEGFIASTALDQPQLRVHHD